MKSKMLLSLPAVVLSLALAPNTFASTIWYVNGVNGSDSDSCTAPTSACKTIGHAISLAGSGDTIRVAAATYLENPTIPGLNLNLIGAGASTTIIDGHGAGSVIVIYHPGGNFHVTLSKITVRNGVSGSGAGIYNNSPYSTLTIDNCIVTGNWAWPGNLGGGILNTGTLTINSSTVSDNLAGHTSPGYGAGIYNWDTGRVRINNSTISGNYAFCGSFGCGNGAGGGIYNRGHLWVNNSTVAGNSAIEHYFLHGAESQGGGIFNAGYLFIANSTLSGNYAHSGGGIFGQAALQNSIIANNSGGNCYRASSSGYNLSSDNTCNFSGSGSLNNIDPRLGTLGYYGGPTQTIPILSGSPAIDAGNPSGCTDNQGILLKTDQRGMPRPDREDKSGCDMGAYESQSD